MAYTSRALAGQASDKDVLVKSINRLKYLFGSDMERDAINQLSAQIINPSGPFADGRHPTLCVY
jgi:hypothetical protein